MVAILNGSHGMLSSQWVMSTLDYYSAHIVHLNYKVTHDPQVGKFKLMNYHKITLPKLF